MKNEMPFPMLRRSTRLLLAATVLLFAFIPRPAGFAQGELIPPGAPTPTMKTLQQVEPRTDLQATPAPAGVDTTNPAFHFIINQPGSYYLSANLGVTKANGIQINAEGVTLDLNGFEISRASGSGGNGIEIGGSSHRASVRNGSLKGFAYGIRSILVTGNYARACGFRDLSASNCTTAGIHAGEGAVLESCRAYDNSGTYGIHASSGSSLTNCTATRNTVGNGIYAEHGSSLTNCSATDNTAQYGIYVRDGSSLTNCSALRNTSGGGSAGIRADPNSTISHCTASNNTYSGGTPSSSSGMGFHLTSTGSAGSTIQGCTASSNHGDGIRLTGDSVARNNTCDSNGANVDGAGIHADGFGGNNRIEGNNVTDNDRGIDVDLAGNLIIKNSASGNTINYDIAAGNVFGAIVNTVVPMGSPTPAPVSGSSASSSIATTDPWANISY